jgi:transcriptional regulator
MTKERGDLLQGTLDMLVLKALQLEAMHGWGITERIEQWSEHVLQLGQGTLYPALYRLERQELIRSEWRITENSRRARYYSLTRQGRRQLETELAQWGTHEPRRQPGARRHRAVAGGIMRWMREGWRRLRSLTRTDGIEHGLDEEILFHIEQQTDKNLRAGLPPDEARRQAYIQFGGVEQFKESARDEFRPVLIQDSLLDLRYALRSLRRAPVFTLVAALTLALGIGATTAVFTVVHGVLIKPLPFRDSDALVSLKHTSKDVNGGPPYGLSLSLFLSYTQENRSFEQLGVWSRGTEHVTDGVLPEEVTTLNVSAGTLRALAVRPAIGRWFSEDDQAPDSPETVILMDGYWARRFGRDPSIVGRQGCRRLASSNGDRGSCRRASGSSTRLPTSSCPCASIREP